MLTDQGEYQDYISQRQYNTVTISEQLSPSCRRGHEHQNGQ